MSLSSFRRRAVRAGLLAIVLFGVSASQATAIGRPIVSVPAVPAEVSAGAYRLSAKVSPNGFPTLATIQYGSSMSYGRSFAPVTLWDNRTRTFSRVTVSMPAGSTVHYRVRATNLWGTTYGPDQTYVVAGSGAPIVTAGARPQAVPDTRHALTLHGTVDPGAVPAQVKIQVGATESYSTSYDAGVVDPGSPRDVSATVVDPVPGSTLNYRIVATNANGTTYGPNQRFKVPYGVVRTVYMHPTDRPFRQHYADLIHSALLTIQDFYLGQVGTTFTLASEPVVCALPRDNAYYASEEPNGSGGWTGTWSKLDIALSACPGLARDGYSDFIVYADVHSVSCHDRIGAATTNLTFLGDGDLHGLDGETGMSNEPCGTGTDWRTGPWGFTGGAAHELGHTFGLPHPDDILATCQSPAPWTADCQYAYASLMYIGYGDLRSTYLLERDKATLRASPFFS